MDPVLSRFYRISRLFPFVIVLILTLLCACGGNGDARVSTENAAAPVIAMQPETDAQTTAAPATEAAAPPQTTAAPQTAAPPETTQAPEITVPPEATAEKTVPQSALTEGGANDTEGAPAEPAGLYGSEKSAPADEPEGRDYVVNVNTGKFHYPYCQSVPQIKPKNRSDRVCTRESLIEQGFVPCKNCNP